MVEITILTTLIKPNYAFFRAVKYLMISNAVHFADLQKCIENAIQHNDNNNS